MSALAAALAALPRQDALRRAGARLGGPRDWKEWLHFVIHTPELHLIVNFSVLDDVWGAPEGPAEAARVIVLARTAAWDGVVERVVELQVAGEGLDARFGASRVRCVGGSYLLDVNLGDGAFRATLRLEPVSRPFQAMNLQLFPGRTLPWLFVPRLRATGEVWTRGQAHQLRGAEAYHDHNWGRYLWGQDFCWDWTSILPTRPEDPWSAVAVRLTDRARHVVRSQVLFLVQHEEIVGLFRDEELEFALEGRLDQPVGLVLPPIMGMLAQGAALSVPARVRVTARRGAESLALCFEARDRAAVVVPAETGVGGSITLNEVSGSARIEGRWRGQAIAMAGAGILEHIVGDTRSIHSPDLSPSPPEDPGGSGVGAAVARSLRALSRERPAAMARLGEALGGLRIAIAVDDARFDLSIDGRAAGLSAPAPDAPVSVSTSRVAILDIVDGKHTLETAVRCGAVRVRGRVGDLARVQRALAAYVEGAVRSPSFSALLIEFRNNV